MADWNTRKAASGVFLYNGFDTEADCGTIRYRESFGAPEQNPYVDFPLGGGWPGTQPFWRVSPGNDQYPAANAPQLDPAVKCGTGASLKFTAIAGGDTDAAGVFGTRLSADDSILIGAIEDATYSSHLYYSYRTLHSPGFLAISRNMGGIKISDVVTGGAPRGYNDTSAITKLVWQTFFDRNFPHCYGRNQNNSDSPVEDGSLGINYQNQFPTCNYPNWLGCWEVTEGTWNAWLHDIEFFHTCDRNGNNQADGTHRHVRIKIYSARDGDLAWTKLIDWGQGTVGYYPMWRRVDGDTVVQNLGRINFFPYMTNGFRGHGSFTVNYDELIASTQMIAVPDPSGHVSSLPGSPAITPRRTRIYRT
jgi:hypothetical protein